MWMTAFYLACPFEKVCRAGLATINVDSMGYDDALTALISGLSGLEPFLLKVSEDTGIDLRLFRPFQINSDHDNFASAGIPAFRLVGGFGDPASQARHVLTKYDTRDKLNAQSMERAATLTTSIVANARTASHEAAVE